MAQQLFDERLEETKKKNLQDWPEGYVVNGKWNSWLPEDWTAATKMTVNKLLLDCYIGPLPERKMFFHKADVEKYLGKKLPNTLRGPKPRTLPPGLQDQFNEEHFLERTKVPAKEKYIAERCNAVHGMQIKEVLKSFKFMQPKSHSQMKLRKSETTERPYSVADLKYDLKYRRLKVVETKPVGPPPAPEVSPKEPGQRKLPKVSRVARSLQVRRTVLKKSKEPEATSTDTSTSKASSSAGESSGTSSLSKASSSARESSGDSVAAKKKRSSSSSAQRVGKKARLTASCEPAASSRASSAPSAASSKATSAPSIPRFAPSTPAVLMPCAVSSKAISAPSTPGFAPSTPAVRMSPRVVPCTPPPVTSRAPSTPAFPSTGTVEVLRRVVNKFKSHQATTQEDELNILAVKGFGYENGVDETALSLLHKVAGKHPALRTALDDVVIETLDEEFRKIIGR